MKRNHGCNGKVKHGTKMSATVALRRIERDDLEVYQCRRCDCWHIGLRRGGKKPRTQPMVAQWA